MCKNPRKKNASYVLTVKGNQKSLREQLEKLFAYSQRRFPELIRTCTTVEKAHGRFEERKISALATHATELSFPGVQQIAKLQRRREVLKTGKVQRESVFLITNLDHTQASVEKLLELKRQYWEIENKLHYRKDFVFNEDRSTIRAEYGPENMSTLRNFAISLLMANKIDNVKRCVDNLRYSSGATFHRELFATP